MEVEGEVEGILFGHVNIRFEAIFLGFSYNVVQHPEEEQKGRSGEDGALAEDTKGNSRSVAEFPLDVREEYSQDTGGDKQSYHFG